MTGTREVRSVKITEFRDAQDGRPPGFTARAVNYGVRDSYGTSWVQGVFEDSLRENLPPVVWCHDWSDPVGRVVGYTDNPDGLDIDVDLDDFEAVPRARQAYAQLKSGTMRQFSFAFLRASEQPDPDLPDTTQITSAQVDEFSIVLVGSVPGTHTTGVRAVGNTVPVRLATDLINRLSAGTIDLRTATAELRGLPVQDITPRFEIRAVDGTGGGDDAMAVLTEVDTAIAAMQAAFDADKLDDARKFFSKASNRLWELQYLFGMLPTYASDWEYYAAGESEKRSAVEPDPEATADDEVADDEVAEDIFAGLDVVPTRAVLAPRRWTR